MARIIKNYIALVLLMSCMMLIAAGICADENMVSVKACKKELKKCSCDPLIMGQLPNQITFDDKADIDMKLQFDEISLQAYQDTLNELATINPPTEESIYQRVSSKIDGKLSGLQDNFQKEFMARCHYMPKALGKYKKSSGQILIDQCLCKQFCSELVQGVIWHEFAHSIFANSPIRSLSLSVANILRAAGDAAAADRVIAEERLKQEILAHKYELNYTTELQRKFSKDCKRKRPKTSNAPMPVSFFDRVLKLMNMHPVLQ
ncbi:MAG TPA: hypothetical protein VK448_04705 [Dissulfurispiraceae bacterium]|nr:hypothetical protein [Dissulfurispiraceae bacterium]